jgi:hypothetical protein
MQLVGRQLITHGYAHTGTHMCTHLLKRVSTSPSPKNSSLGTGCPMLINVEFPRSQLGLRGAVAGRPQPVMLSQAEEPAEGKTAPVGCVWLGRQNCETEAANQPLGILPSLPLG